MKNVPESRYIKVQPGCGIWAPAIRFYAGKFWIFFPTPDEGIYVTTADHPAGMWSEPRLLQAGKGLIDPCPLWDDDGQAYLVHAYAGSRAGIKHLLRVRPMAPDGSRLLGEGQIVYQNPQRHPTLEGPKFFKRYGWYYISAPAGGVENGWQVILRSRTVYGPYEDKIVLAQGETTINGPHQGALVDTPKGEWWFLHFQDAELYGRIVHLQPVRWENDWPLIGIEQDDLGVGRPVMSYRKPSEGSIIVPQTSDEFDQPQLGLQWQWFANHRDDWYSLATRPGWMRLFPQAAETNLHLQANFLLQKFPARSFAVETTMELFPKQSGEEAGLVVTGESPMMLGIRYDGSKNLVILRTGEKQEILADSISPAVKFCVRVQDGGLCSFSYAPNGDFIEVPHPVQARKGLWIGSKLGLYSLKRSAILAAGYADIDYFRFMK
ncbi:MAG: glycoside hydrolase [Ignavibacteriae bacterium]|nr:MAG: glycoside hydrolase [Ignavibacteriota bacterium]